MRGDGCVRTRAKAIAVVVVVAAGKLHRGEHPVEVELVDAATIDAEDAVATAERASRKLSDAEL